MKTKKSQFLGLGLTFFFGPLGLLYSSLSAAFFCIAMAVFLALVTAGIGGIGALLIWPVTWVISLITVSSHNHKVFLEDERFQKMLEATKYSNRERFGWPQ